MTLYQIKDWQKFYEASDNRKTDGPLSWVAIRTKTDGLGFRRVVAQKNRSDLLSAWYLMVGLAAKQPRAERGKLARNGVPLTPADMEMMTGWPAKVFTDALAFFSSHAQQWLEVVELSDSVRGESDETGQVPSTIPTNITIPHQTNPTFPASPEGGGGKSDIQIRVEAIFGRRVTTPLSAYEAKAWKSAKAIIEATTPEDFAMLEAFYREKDTKEAPLYRRTSLSVLLNNWSGEIDKARKWRSTASEFSGAF